MQETQISSRNMQKREVLQPMCASVFVRRWEKMWVQAGIDKPSVAFWRPDRKSVSHDLNIGILSDCTEGLVCLLPAQTQTKSFKHTQEKRQWTRLLGLSKTKKKEMFIVSLLSCPYWQIPNHYSCIWTEQSWTLQLNNYQFPYQFGSYLSHHTHSQFPLTVKANNWASLSGRISSPLF